MYLPVYKLEELLRTLPAPSTYKGDFLKVWMMQDRIKFADRDETTPVSCSVYEFVFVKRFDQNYAGFGERFFWSLYFPTGTQ